MKRILALTLLLLSIIAIAEPALARPGGSSGGQWETVTVTLQSLVSSIGEFLDFTDIETGAPVVRGAFFLLLFIMFYPAGIRAFGQPTTEKSRARRPRGQLSRRSSYLSSLSYSPRKASS